MDIRERAKWLPIAMELTIQDALSDKYRPDGGLECEYAEAAMAYLDAQKNDAWLNMREGWIS